MLRLSTDLHNRCWATLLKCDEFESRESLRAVFAPDELYPFRDGLPDATSKKGRVDRCLEYLLSQHLSGGRPVFPLFLTVLCARYYEGDDRCNELENLIKEVEAAIGLEKRPPTVVASPLGSSTQSQSLAHVSVLFEGDVHSIISTLSRVIEDETEQIRILRIVSDGES